MENDFEKGQRRGWVNRDKSQPYLISVCCINQTDQIYKLSGKYTICAVRSGTEVKEGQIMDSDYNQHAFDFTLF